MLQGDGDVWRLFLCWNHRRWRSNLEWEVPCCQHQKKLPEQQLMIVPLARNPDCDSAMLPSLSGSASLALHQSIVGAQNVHLCSCHLRDFFLFCSSTGHLTNIHCTGKYMILHTSKSIYTYNQLTFTFSYQLWRPWFTFKVTAMLENEKWKCIFARKFFRVCVCEWVWGGERGRGEEIQRENWVAVRNKCCMAVDVDWVRSTRV